MRDRSAAMHHDDERSLASYKVDEKLEKGIYGECFVDVSEGIDPEGCLQRDQARERCNGVYGDHEKDADHISLQQRLSVVLRLKPYGAILESSRLATGIPDFEATHTHTNVKKVAVRAATPHTITTALPNRLPVPPLPVFCVVVIVVGVSGINIGCGQQLDWPWAYSDTSPECRSRWGVSCV